MLDDFGEASLGLQCRKRSGIKSGQFKAPIAVDPDGTKHETAQLVDRHGSAVEGGCDDFCRLQPDCIGNAELREQIRDVRIRHDAAEQGLPVGRHQSAHLRIVAE